MKLALLKLAYQARRVYWRLFSPRTIGVKGIVLDDDGRVLLVRHSYGPRQWYLPGGGVQRRESLTEALTRELWEETGVVPTGPMRLLGTYSSLTEGKSDHIAVFVVERWTRTDRHDDEIAEARFFPVDQLPAEAAGGTRRRVADMQNGAVSDFRW